MKILVTGAAGFIGYHTALRLLERGDAVVGVDNMNDYYDVRLKQARCDLLRTRPAFSFRRLDLAARDDVRRLFDIERFTHVIHLGAQAGVRYSFQNPVAYIDSNIVGFAAVLDACRHTGVKHLVYASSSSVYGANRTLPYSVHENVDHPISLYAATKKANELLAHSYSYLYGLPTTGLRFFTVYGPWGRPDMAYFKFTGSILAGQPIDIYNHGDMYRDFTYVDDIVEGVIRVNDRPAEGDERWSGEHPDPATSSAPYRVYNIGNNRPEKLTRMIEILEEAIGRKAILNLLPMQPGDMQATAANVDDLATAVGFSPSTSLEIGLPRFVRWYREYHHV